MGGVGRGKRRQTPAEAATALVSCGIWPQWETKHMRTRDTRCRSCDGQGAEAVDIDVTHRRARLRWTVNVCRDCWRAWEALLDGAQVGAQLGLAASMPFPPDAKRPWFW